MPVSIEKIMKKEYFQDSEHNKKFDKDYYPYLSSPARHIPESIIVKTVYPLYK
jgi:hypothetical protein